jgi:hypothetical protein
LFERADRRGQPGLRDLQEVRRTGEVALLGYGHEVLELT